MIQWIKTHPWQNIIYTAVFTNIVVVAAHRPDWKPQLIGLFLLGVICWLLSYLFGRTAVVVAALLCSTMPDTRAQSPFPPRDPEPQFEPAALGVAAAVAVLCVGAYCVYKFNKFCAKKFPPKDTGSNSLSAFAASGAQGGDEYGGSYNYGVTGSCHDSNYELAPSSEDEEGTLYRLNIIVDSPYSMSQRMTATSGGGQGFQTFLEFQAEMAAHGLNISGVPDGTQSFSWNRIPIDPTMSPISFDPITKTVRNALAGEGETRRIVVSRSSNLRDWAPLLSTEVGIGAGIQVVDATRHGQMFYKVEMLQP